MRPPGDHEVDCRNPVSVAWCAEARARFALDVLDELPRSATEARAETRGRAKAYADMAALLVGLSPHPCLSGLVEAPDLKEIRSQIFILGRACGIVP